MQICVRVSQMTQDPSSISICSMVPFSFYPDSSDNTTDEDSREVDYPCDQIPPTRRSRGTRLGSSLALNCRRQMTRSLSPVLARRTFKGAALVARIEKRLNQKRPSKPIGTKRLVVKPKSCEECCICLQSLDSLSSYYCSLICGTVVHQSCLLKYASSVCPVCRTSTVYKNEATGQHL